jgi:hypothetical protein
MSSAEARAEHFVTIFDHNYLAAGLCLYRSLKAHGGPFHLWVVCMDELVERRLRELALPEVHLLALAEVETDALRRVRGGRTMGEYCWTLTPFSPQFVLERRPDAQRVTYLDADVYFFGDPRALLDELDASGAHVLITPHAYSPEYDQSAYTGIYCVQFVTFRNSPEARVVQRWWQERCIEWCFARGEDGKFGDQKYLDDWPKRFPGAVHVLSRHELALGPWNANRFIRDEAFLPIFFHFHGLRVVSGRRLLLYSMYRLTAQARRPYAPYVAEFTQVLAAAYARWGEIPGAGIRPGLKERLRRLWYSLTGAIRYADYRVERPGS